MQLLCVCTCEHIKIVFTLEKICYGLDLDPEVDPDPEEDPDPHSSQSLDPDPHSSKSLDPDPDPHIVNADSKHWLQIRNQMKYSITLYSNYRSVRKTIFDAMK
jgi:hypothetical protein